jgi:hypothetical protein
MSLVLGTPSVQWVHDIYPFALEDGGRMAPMAAELVDRLGILVAVCRFLGMGAPDPRSLRFYSCVRMQHFVRRTTYAPFRRFWGMCGESSFNVFLLSMVLSVPIFAMPCRRVVLMMWHAFLFLELRLFPFFSFCLVAYAAFSCNKLSYFCCTERYMVLYYTHPYRAPCKLGMDEDITTKQ